MGNKEYLIYLGLSVGVATAINTRGVDLIRLKENCQAVTIEHNFIKGGLTLPLSIGGETSIIFFNDTRVLPHETGHVRQICRDGGAGFIAGYLHDHMKYEKEADGGR